MYMPTLARFTALDPMPPDGEPVLLGASRYAYVENDPMNRSDPSGLRQGQGVPSALQTPFHPESRPDDRPLHQ